MLIDLLDTVRGEQIPLGWVRVEYPLRDSTVVVGTCSCQYLSVLSLDQLTLIVVIFTGVHPIDRTYDVSSRLACSGVKYVAGYGI